MRPHAPKLRRTRCHLDALPNTSIESAVEPPPLRRSARTEASCSPAGVAHRLAVMRLVKDFGMDDEDGHHLAWTLLRPDSAGRLCLGELRPGMTREEVAAFAAPYGPVEHVEDNAIRTANMAAGFADLDRFGFTADTIAAAREAWAGVADAVADLVTEHRGLGAPVLDYAGGRLSRVATDHHCTRLTLLGRPVYEGDGSALLAALERLAGGTALRNHDTIWFPCLGVTAVGFYGEREDETIGLLNDPGDLRIRHLVLEAWEPASDSPQPVPVTFRDL